MVVKIRTTRERTTSSSSVSVSQAQGSEEVGDPHLTLAAHHLVRVHAATAPLQMVRDKDKAERKRKAEMARLRREKIMAQMSEMQKHFINENKELFQQSLEELEASGSTSATTSDNRWGPGWKLQLEFESVKLYLKV